MPDAQEGNQAMDTVVIAGAARTPMGGFQGDLSPLTAAELGGAAISAALEGAGGAAADVDEVLMGCVLPAGQGQAPARQAGFLAGLAKTCRRPRSTRCAARA
jgi:acetyl-CoA C-acetyltransferase